MAWSAKISASSIRGICHGRSGCDFGREGVIATSHQARVLQRRGHLADILHCGGGLAGLLADMAEVGRLLGSRLLSAGLRLEGIGFVMVLQPFGWGARAFVDATESLVEIDIGAHGGVELHY